MTPERWRQVDALFHAALEREPAQRESWLRQACNGDDDLRADVMRLLAGDERAGRDEFLKPPEGASPVGSRPMIAPSARAETGDAHVQGPQHHEPGFTPKAAICEQVGGLSIDEMNALGRERLLALAI